MKSRKEFLDFAILRNAISMLLGLIGVLALSSGCASYLARKNLEGVAKGWCQMVRASQVIPVYPLTQDLVVGDVFLVQTPIAAQASEYDKKGFLSLDDAQVRLNYTNFSKMYFDAYWKDEFGATPHPVPYFTNANTITSTQSVLLTQAPLPRAAFPSYSFKAQSGFGVNAAFPIQGIPVALSYLNSGQVDGSVSISDARTYAGDSGQLLSLLNEWVNIATNKNRLAEIAKNAAPTKIFLRVVSRVYLVRAVDVSLHRSGSQGAGLKAGTINDVSLLTKDGGVNPNYTNILNALNTQATAIAGAVTSATQVGGAFKFVSASESTVGLSQSFDRLLAIGYLGFDVQIDPSGELGAPVPTFQYLTGQIKTPPAPTAFQEDSNTLRIQNWLRNPAAPANRDLLKVWLQDAGLSKFGVSSILHGQQFADTRAAIVKKFNLK